MTAIYIIYIMDKGRQYWLRDMIASDKCIHPAFTTEMKYIMKFDGFDAAMAWRERLVLMGYEPHIEAYHGRWP